MHESIITTRSHRDFKIEARMTEDLCVVVHLTDLWSGRVRTLKQLDTVEDAVAYIDQEVPDLCQTYYDVPPCWVELNGVEQDAITLVAIGFALPQVIGIRPKTQPWHTTLLLGAVSVNVKHSPWEVARMLTQPVAADPLAALEDWRENQGSSVRLVPFPKGVE